jgi:hypothetical protein
VTTIAPSAPRPTGRGLVRRSVASLWRLFVLALFSPIHHGWSRRATVGVTFLSETRRHGRRDHHTDKAA